MSYCSEPNQRDTRNLRRVRRLDREVLTIRQLRGSRGDRWLRSLKQIRWREEFSAELIRRLGIVVKSAATTNQDASVGQKQCFGMIQSGRAHGSDRGPSLCGWRPELRRENS